MKPKYLLPFLCSLFLGFTPLFGQSDRIGLPVLFVHGFCEGAQDFHDTEINVQVYLKNAYPRQYERSRGYFVFFDEDQKQVQFELPGSKMTSPTVDSKERFFSVAFDDPGQTLVENFNPIEVAGISIYSKADELAHIIWKIKALTGAPRVILVAHSMGGLASRAYIEGLGAEPYLNDISTLVTLDTPHGGSLLSLLGFLRFRLGPCWLQDSLDKEEMHPSGGKSIIPQLNYFAPGALPLPPALIIYSIQSYWLAKLRGWGTDDVLSADTQDLFSNLDDPEQNSLSVLILVPDTFDFFFPPPGGNGLCGVWPPLHFLECTGAAPQTLDHIEREIRTPAVMTSGVQVNPSSAKVDSGDHLQFSAVTASGAPAIWSLLEGPDAGSIDSQGLYRAPGSPQTCHVVAIDSVFTTQYGIATVMVTSEVAISPSSVTVPEAGLQTFSATVTIGGGVTWSVEEGSAGGTITNIGIYTPPSTTGVFHVVATSAKDPSQYAVATVTIVPALVLNVLYAFPLQGRLFIYGEAPWGGLIQTADGYLYGTTSGGGNYQSYGEYWDCFNGGCGTVFKTDTAGDLTPLHLFVASDGAVPTGGVILATNGLFYGTTSGGGNSEDCVVNGGIESCGTLLRIDEGGNFTVLHSFIGTDGAFPQSSLVQAPDGYFYGTTSGGGDPSSCTNFQTPGCGTIFKADTSGNISILHLFNGADGAVPWAGLSPDGNGNFYGTTSQGGSFGDGTIFKMDAQGAITLLHSFQGTDGAVPYTSVLLARDGKLYGTTWRGGTDGVGVVFRIDTAGNFAVLHNFAQSDGDYPFAPIIQGADGFFYGTTYEGGAFNEGAVFKMDLAGNITVLHSFAGPDGAAPAAGLLIGADGYFYGSTSGGGINDGNGGGGEIYRFSDPTSNDIQGNRGAPQLRGWVPR